MKLHLKLLLLAAAACCLIDSCSCMQKYYCDSYGTTNIRDIEFYIVTREYGRQHYEQGISCSFRTVSRTYFIEVVEFDVGLGSRVSVMSGSKSLLYGSRVADYDRNFITKSSGLSVKFNAGSDYRRTGVTLRVRYVDMRRDCPTGWITVPGLSRVCIGTSPLYRPLSFTEAQESCNNMRANLLVVPRTYGSGLRTLLQWLPRNWTQDAWVGLTDRWSRYKYRWLDGSSYSDLRSITCKGRGYDRCDSRDRCAATFIYSSRYALQMHDCSYRRSYICSMPVGGAYTLHSVPKLSFTYAIRKPVNWIWVGFGCFMAFGFLAAVTMAIRRSRMQRAQRAAGVASQSPASLQQQQRQQQQHQLPAGSYPTQSAPYPPPPQYPGVSVCVSTVSSVSAGMPQPAAQAPPPYEQVMNGAGQGNPAFK